MIYTPNSNAKKYFTFAKQFGMIFVTFLIYFLHVYVFFTIFTNNVK